MSVNGRCVECGAPYDGGVQWYIQPGAAYSFCSTCHSPLKAGANGRLVSAFVGSDALGNSFRFSGEVGEQRKERLERNTMTGYHQTSHGSADKIVVSQQFMRGNPDCLAGSGIYFATNPNDTNHKARNEGPILMATVKLGRVKRISPYGDKSITFSNLLEEGYDSVHIPRGGGDEYVVYNWDQVTNIRRYSNW